MRIIHRGSQDVFMIKQQGCQNKLSLKQTYFSLPLNFNANEDIATQFQQLYFVKITKNEQQVQ